MVVDVNTSRARVQNASFPRWVARVGGLVFLVLGIWGFFTPNPLGVNFALTMPHNWVHILTALVLLYVGFAPVALAAVTNTLKVLGGIYLVLGVIGFFVVSILGIILTIPDNIFHLLVGGLFVWAGFMPATERAPVRERRPTV